MVSGKGQQRSFYVQNGLLYNHDQVLGQPVQQMCVPQERIAKFVAWLTILATKALDVRTKEYVLTSIGTE